MTTSCKGHPYLSAVYAELASISEPFEQHLEKLDEVINRSERDGLCSKEVAEAARDKIYECIRELETLIVKTSNSFPYAPDPRNGEVYATKIDEIKYVDGVETETFGGFVVVHMADDGDSAAIFWGYETLEEAEADAERIARERKAVLS